MQQSLGRQVAIKILAYEPDEDSDFAQRFKKEGRILAQLLHPNIVTIHDIGVSEDNQLFLSIEYLSGGTLKDQIKQGLSLDSVIQIAKSIAKALGYAHEKGVIHRDIKPSNIMFRHDGTPVLTDFGIARVAGSKTVHTITGLMVGSPGYMSPEQAMGESATIQSDLYGLGVVLYEMLTRHPPYEGDNPLAVMLKHLHDPIPKIPKEYSFLQPIVNKLLAKKTQDRYKNTNEFLEAINLLVPSDTGSQPEWITGNKNQSVMEFASGKIRSLMKRKSQFTIWIFMIGTATLLMSTLYIFKSKIATKSTETLPKLTKPVEPMTPMLRETEIAMLLKQAEAQLKAGLFTDESELGTETAYRRVLKLDPGNAQALTGLENIAKEYERLARQHLEAGAPQDGLAKIRKGLTVAPDYEGLMRLRQQAEQQIAQRQARQVQQEQQQQVQLQAEQLLMQANSSFGEGLLELSLAHIEQGLLAVPNHPGLSALRDQVRARMIEQQHQVEARRQEEEAARRKAEIADRQKAEQDRQQVEAIRQREEADRYLARALNYQRSGGYAASLQQINKGLAVVPNHEGLLRLQEKVRVEWSAEQRRQEARRQATKAAKAAKAAKEKPPAQRQTQAPVTPPKEDDDTNLKKLQRIKDAIDALDQSLGR
jgi:serine/threonine-protein kinase PpkA